ncbi:MAG: hypothetical protein C6W56_15055 [Caldibacillus debilis]|nr:MAG: hypothetical protein C6W56_15055 [Caldibacillus debilis]
MIPPDRYVFGPRRKIRGSPPLFRFLIPPISVSLALKEAVSKGRQTDLLGTASVSFSDHLVIYSFFEVGISPYF